MADEKLLCQRCGYEQSPAGELTCPRDGLHLISESEHRKAPRDSFLGTTLGGRYPILGVIGSGGMGTVYRSIQPIIEREVAIKVILPGRLERSGDTEQRFLREARSIARLQHPAVVTLYDFGVAEDATLYMVMELVRGRSLSSCLAEGSLSMRELLELAQDVLGALDVAHRQGLIHRDIKPDNILVLPQDARFERGTRAKLLDFGLVKMIGQSGLLELTKSGLISGTPHYMSPEQASGRGVDPRSDIYSLGSVLYEGLAGAPPYQADSHMAVLSMRVMEDPPPLTSLSWVPPALAEVVMKAMSREPGERFGDARQMAHALDALCLPQEADARLAALRLTDPSGEEACDVSTITGPQRGARQPESQDEPPELDGPSLPRRDTFHSLFPQVPRGGAECAEQHGLASVSSPFLQSASKLDAGPRDQRALQADDDEEPLDLRELADGVGLPDTARVTRGPGSVSGGEVPSTGSLASPSMHRGFPASPGAGARGLAQAEEEPLLVERSISHHTITPVPRVATPIRPEGEPPSAGREPSSKSVLRLAAFMLLILVPLGALLGWFATREKTDLSRGSSSAAASGKLVVAAEPEPRPAATAAIAVPRLVDPAVAHRQAEEALQAARASLKAGDQERARELLDRALGLNADLHVARYLLARSLLGEGRAEDAEDQLRLAMKTTGDQLVYGYWTAIALEAQGKDGEAKDLLLKLEAYLDAAPGRIEQVPDFYLHLGKILLRRGLSEQAVRHLSRSLGPSERRSEPWFLTGEGLFRLNLYEKSIGFFQEAIARKPNHVEAHFKIARANLLRDKPNRGEAIRHFRKTILLDKKHRHIEARKYLGYLYRDGGDTRQALHTLNGYLRLLTPQARDRSEVLREIAALSGRRVRRARRRGR